MPRLYLCLRLLAVTVASPVILLYLVILTLLHPLQSLRAGFRIPVRLWMCVSDWVKGIPVGYSYWEQYEAASMLDEIAVHHDE